MKNILIKDIYKILQIMPNKAVKISGWIRTVRASSEFGFIELNDGSFFQECSNCI